MWHVETASQGILGGGRGWIPGGGIRVASGLTAAIHRLDDAPPVQPSSAGVVGEALDAAESNRLVTERPVSDELFGDGSGNGDGGASPSDVPPVQVDRTHRIGQTRAVMVHRLVSANTIESKVLSLSARKAKLFADVLDGGEGTLGGQLTADEIRGLVS